MCVGVRVWLLGGKREVSEGRERGGRREDGGVDARLNRSTLALFAILSGVVPVCFLTSFLVLLVVAVESIWAFSSTFSSSPFVPAADAACFNL